MDGSDGARRGFRPTMRRLRDAELLEERLRVRDLVQPAEHFVEFYARVAAAAGVERRGARALHAAFERTAAAGA